VYGESFRYLLTHTLYLTGLLGAYWLWRTGRLTLGCSLWLGNLFLWTLVYFTAIFWYRFALPALFLATPPAAYLLCQVLARLTAGLPPRPLKLMTAGLLAGYFLWVFPVTGLDYLKTVAQYQKNPPGRLVEYLRKYVPRRSLIETPEYELVFLDDDHRFHLMPAYYIVESGEKGVLLLNPRQDPYNFNKIKADVLILGHYGKSIFAQVYPPALVHKYWRKVAQLDYYDIYVRRSSPPLIKAVRPVKLCKPGPLPNLQFKGNEAYDPGTPDYSLFH
jgi:hypothetical protein